MEAVSVQSFLIRPLDVAGGTCCSSPHSTRSPIRGAAAHGRLILGQERRRRNFRVSVRSASVSTIEQTTYEKARGNGARWAGDDPLARVVSSLIAIEPLYKAMVFFARKVMVRTAEESGVPWEKIVKEMRESDVYSEKERLENVDLSYPDYYQKPFHAYETGNLNWEAAFESEPATRVTFVRAFPDMESPELAEETSRVQWLNEVNGHHTKFSDGLQVKSILDMGCSTGNSSRYIRDYFPDAQITGMDLSPYFLAVAEHIQKQQAAKMSPIKRNIHYMHADIEQTGLPSESFDIVSCAFVLHEMPQYAIASTLREARRLLRPGGTITTIDTSLMAKVIQDLPPALFVLMKATEPWLDEFFALNLKEELERSGFGNVTTTLTSPRHATVTATAV